MWKLVALASLALAFALGGNAHAKCGVCIDKVTAELGTAGSTPTVHLIFSGAREHAEVVAPEHPTAVVMQIDGNRTKCLTVALSRVADDGNNVVYKGTFAGYHASHGNHQSSYEGRVEVGGSVFEFKVSVDGTPGVIKLVDVVAPPVVVQPAIAPASVARAAPVSQAVTVDEVPASAPAGTIFDRIATPDGTGWMLALAVVAFLGATLLIERRGARKTTAESALEA